MFHSDNDLRTDWEGAWRSHWYMIIPLSPAVAIWVQL